MRRKRKGKKARRISVAVCRTNYENRKGGERDFLFSLLARIKEGKGEKKGGGGGTREKGKKRVGSNVRVRPDLFPISMVREKGGERYRKGGEETASPTSNIWQLFPREKEGGEKVTGREGRGTEGKKRRVLFSYGTSTKRKEKVIN